MPGYVLNESDAVIIRQLVDRERQRQQNLRIRPAGEDSDGHASDVYIAHVPAGGIPAITSSGGAGTGSPALHGDVPGSAECAVYRRLPGRMLPVGLNLTVYNYSSAATAGDRWIPVAKEKFGDWTALAQVESSGGTSAFSGANCVTGSSITIPDSTPTAISFGDGSYDTDNYFDTGAPTVMVVPSTGFYLVGLNVVWTAGSGGETSISLTCAAGGASQTAPQNGISLGSQGMSLVTLFNMVSGDSVVTEVLQTSGFDLDIISAEMWIAKLGS